MVGVFNLESLMTLLTIAIGSLVANMAAVQEAPRMEAVDAVTEALMQQGQFPGAVVAVTQDGQPVHLGAYGLASLAHEAPVTAETVFELASLTKHMTSLAVLTLAEEGRLSLSDRLVNYVPNAPDEWSQITIDHLLSHMSGLAHRFEEQPNGEFLLNYSTADMLDSAMQTPTLFEPGADWSYSDQGYFLLGVVVEAVTGDSFEAFLRSRFWEPLGMSQTTMLDQSAIVAHRAEGYGVYDGVLARNRRVWQFGLTSHFGVTTSMHDLLIWEAELNDPQLLSEAVLDRSAEIQRVFDTGESCERWGYGRGWQSYEVDGRKLTSHGGYSGTAFLRDLTTGQSVMVLTNREDGPDLLSPMAIAWSAAHHAGMDVPEGGLTCWR